MSLLSSTLLGRWWRPLVNLLYVPDQPSIQSINEDLTSGSSREGDVRDVPSGICNYKLFKSPEHTCKNIGRRESEIKDSKGPLSKATKSVQADLTWEEMILYHYLTHHQRVMCQI